MICPNCEHSALQQASQIQYCTRCGYTWLLESALTEEE